MSKIFVLLEHALLSSENSTLRFDSDNEIVIPINIVKELEHPIHKRSIEKSKIAYQILTYLDSFNTKKLFSTGVKQANGSQLRIATNYHNIEIKLNDINESEKRSLQICLGLKNENPDKDVILISNDHYIRFMARNIGIKSEPFKDETFPEFKDQYTGRKEIFVSSETFLSFSKAKSKKQATISIEDVYEHEKINWITNMFVQIKVHDDDSYTLGRFDGKKIIPLSYRNEKPYGILAKNIGQEFMLETLLNPDIPLVVIKGGAGTGKTFCTLAAGLAALENKEYSRIIVTRTSDTVSNEQHGFLPGDLSDKLSPYLGGIKDNLRQLIHSGNYKKDPKTPIEDGSYLFETGQIQIEAVGFLRGRTIVDTYFIIDETQNIDPSIVKSIVTRAAQGSKFIFLGDPSQIDNPKLSEQYNGLVYVSEKMKGQDICYQITLEDSESVRSKLSYIAAQIL